MKQSYTRTHRILTVLVLICACLIRWAFRGEVSADMRNFLLNWYQIISEYDYKTALSTQVGDYNLLYQMIIYIFTKLPGEAMIKYKILSVAFDFILAAAVYLMVRELSDSRKALHGAWIVLLLPTVWMNSAAWGQCDSIYVSFIILALYFLYRRKVVSSFILLGAAFAFKLQAIFIIPFYGYLFLHGYAKNDKVIRWEHFLYILLVPVVTAIPCFLAGRPLADLFSIYLKQTDTYHHMYMNFPSVWSWFQLQYETDARWAILFTFLLLCALMLWFYQNNADVWRTHFLWCAFILSYTCVLFLPAMHERYSYLYEILSIILGLYLGRGWLAAMVLQLISIRTYCQFLWQTPLNMEFLAVLNLLVYGFVIYAFRRELQGKPIKTALFDREKAENKECVHRYGKWQWISRKDTIRMLILSMAFLVIGGMHLGSMKAPESSVTLGTDPGLKKEVLISLKYKEYIDSVCIYQPIESESEFLLFAAKDGKWENLNDQLKTKRDFSWTRVSVDRDTHQLCLIMQEPSAQISEIVCLGKNGKRLQLTAYNEFPELFDEQETLSYYPSAFDQMIFDEIYHGRTAYEFLKKLPIYENTHPPLGKILISCGIAVFGMNPFGYRIICLLFGTLCLPLIYLFTLRITGKSEFAVVAGILQLTEFMHYTLSRIATIDVIVAFFVLAMFYGIYSFICCEDKKYLVLSGLAFACGAATKWTALYAAVGLAVVLGVWFVRKFMYGEYSLKQWKTPALFAGLCILLFAVLPALVYILSYIPFAIAYPEQNILQHAISNSVHMLDYHRNATATHPYASSWYTWLFDWLPLVDYRETIAGKYSVVATFVSPLVCYLGLGALIHHVYLAIKRNRTAMILVLFYFCMLVPWMLITRTVFIYQYFICTKLLILMICHSIYQLCFDHEERVLKLVSGISIILFAMYLPVISGVLVNKAYVDAVLKILPKWWF